LVRSAVVLAAIALVFPIALGRAQGTVYKVGGDVTQPRILSKVDPQYTQEAKDAKIEGAVLLEAEITPSGVAENIRVIRSLDTGLDANAISALSEWRFKPGTKGGEPVTVFARIEINFHLK
jgi:TonB family protein